jgi:peptidyl-prolyl cis-trans isomerase B (cyclophilin B)
VPTNKQRRDAARRKLERQLERRQQQQAHRRQLTVVWTVIGTLVVLAVVIVSVVMLTNDNKKSSASAATTPTAKASASTTPTATTPPGTCSFVKSGTASKPVNLPAAKPPKTGIVTIDMKTSQGDMTLRMDRAKTPCTVESFASLVAQKFYNNTPCHRLTTKGIYVLQCGDPSGTGSGGPGYTIPDEFKTTDKYTRGVLAMANTGQPNTGGSQFFIVYKDTSLPPQYTVFGTVTKGMNVVDRVAAAGATGTTGDGAPKLPIKLTTLTVQ